MVTRLVPVLSKLHYFEFVLISLLHGYVLLRPVPWGPSDVYVFSFAILSNAFAFDYATIN